MKVEEKEGSEIRASHTIEGNLVVQISYIGEGMNGDYNPNDPSDVPLLRIDAIDLVEGSGRGDQDCSFCTLIPTSVPSNVLKSVCKHVAGTLKDLPSWGRKMEGFSWMDEKEALEIHKMVSDLNG